MKIRLFDVDYRWTAFRNLAGRFALGLTTALSVISSSYATVETDASGHLTSATELMQFRDLANQGTEPFMSDASRLISDASQAWRWGNVSGEFTTMTSGDSAQCHPLNHASMADYLLEGAPDVYARVLAYHLTGDTTFADDAKSRILALISTYGYTGVDGQNFSGANQCILSLAFSIPIWIESALLLESTDRWSAQEAASFKHWLANEVYPKVAWASRVRKNNWGAAGSLASSLIASYVDGTVVELTEIAPEPRNLTPRASFSEHNAMQHQRLGVVWRGDSLCDAYGIQNHGGIPDELRRGTTGCDGTHLVTGDDSAHAYQTTHATLLVFHAEALRRLGDLSLTNHSTPNGAAAIKQSILFVIDNPVSQTHSLSWGVSHGAVRVAYWHYNDGRLKDAANQAGSFRGGRFLPYTRITHPAQNSPRVAPPSPPTNLSIQPPG